MSRLARLGITLTIVAVLVVSMAGTGVAATAPPATATDTTETEIATVTDATTTSSNTIPALFQQNQADSCSPLETWLADIFTTYGLSVPDSLSDCPGHDQGADDTDEPSETGSDGSVWDGDSDTETTTDDSGTDDTVEQTEETSDTTDGSSDSDE